NCRSLPIRRDFPNYWFRRLPAGVTTMMDRRVINGRALERNTIARLAGAFLPLDAVYGFCATRED
ncbi:hypothetical protein NPIL_549751, partial [Nephila pilipes]